MEREILEHSVLNEMSLSNPSPAGLGSYAEEEVERLLEVREDG